MLRLLFSFMFCANILWAQDELVPPNNNQLIKLPTKKHLEKILETTPEMLEIIVETDENAQGYRAGHHNFQVQLGMDPLVNGRLLFGFQYRLNHFLMLEVPVAFDHPVLGQWLGRTMGVYDAKIVDQWAMLGGLGLKIRLSEWMLKSSFFIEPVMQAGYYSQTVQYVQKVMTDSIRIRPGLYLGFETVFDTGLVIGVKVGVEHAFDINFRGKPLAYAANFSVVPMFGMGYAW